jgi:hypothetical protein
LLALIQTRDIERTATQLERHLQSQFDWILRSFDEAGPPDAPPADSD